MIPSSLLRFRLVLMEADVLETKAKVSAGEWMEEKHCDEWKKFSVHVKMKSVFADGRLKTVNICCIHW